MTDRTLVDGNAVKQDLGTPGHVKLILFDGDSLGSVGDIATNVGGELVMAPPASAAATGNCTLDFQRFNSSGTWTAPTGLNALSPVLIRMWPGGGSGGLGASAGGGAGGGARDVWTTLGALSGSETVTIGAGGAAKVGASANGAAGGVTSFGAFSTGPGGGGGGNASVGGDGGGPFTAPGGRIYHDVSTPRYHGQGGAAANGDITGEDGIWHGGGGGGSAGGTGTHNNAGNSVYGGGGGAGTNSAISGTAGSSANAGGGGLAGVNGTSGQVGVQPAGGGGAAENTGGASSGAGGAGRVDVTVFGFPV